jgi:HAD superfamily hydrolase (TIGR01509 family)
MNLSNVRAVILDMDGLLVDSERLARAALIQTAGIFGIVPDVEVFTGMIGLPQDGSLNLLRLRYGQDFPAAEFISQTSITSDAMVASGHLKPKKGAQELIEFLERLRVPKAIATSSSREKAMRTLSAVRMAARFDAVVTRTDVPRGKPYPDLFVRAAHELGCATDGCIALEDSYNGVRAAHAAGIRVIMVPDLLWATPEMADLSEAIIPNLSMVLDALFTSKAFSAENFKIADTRRPEGPELDAISPLRG